MGDGTIQKAIMAIITMNPTQIKGGVPVFIADNQEEFQHKAFVLEKILDGMAHEVDPQTMIIVRH
ncbi:capping complex subunit for YIEGIA [Hazenella coriacea]|uniref:Uncharacterized protein n=1 Tax=Hazenella coriacea TaxID=1179467 RepID=A0A4R3L1I3_9BACL|nr:hypothetical protein [Hazenella coriacea]TCS93413.1 hypothetical protein EDD58_10760 [Hazenella coriacea]